MNEDRPVTVSYTHLNGHVAIYIGKGKIVHASSRKTGIKISPKANYRKVLSVRRIVK